MSHSVRILARPETAAGFRLAGLTPRVTEADAGELSASRAEMRTADAGVILMDDRIFQRLPAEDRRRLGRRPLPIVVPFPTPEWRTEREAAEAYVLELLRQVVGYRVRLK
ncbi:MAG TPA: V-type ATP synthase subunit F [Gemmatimonadales bacterium]|nr:V-type ATP synthase subunit F [Gemmatimonadales bacterium]